MLTLVFAGTPPFAADILQALITSPHRIVAVFTQPDRPSGRGRKLTQSAVKSVAEQHQLSLYQPASLKNDEVHEQLRKLKPDVMVVAAYGLLLPQAVLDIPRLGCINVHASLLPRFRGAAPIQQALLEQDKITGVSIMQMNEGLDTGDILLTATHTLLPEDTLGTLEKTLAILGANTLLHVLNAAETMPLPAVVQNPAHATYAHKITKQDAQLLWQHSADHLAHRVRAFNPRPMAYILINDQPIKIHAACALQGHTTATPGTVIDVSPAGIDIAAGDGSILRLLKVQCPGKNAVSVADLLKSNTTLFMLGKKIT